METGYKSEIQKTQLNFSEEIESETEKRKTLEKYARKVNNKIEQYQQFLESQRKETNLLSSKLEQKILGYFNAMFEKSTSVNQSVTQADTR